MAFCYWDAELLLLIRVLFGGSFDIDQWLNISFLGKLVLFGIFSESHALELIKN